MDAAMFDLFTSNRGGGGSSGHGNGGCGCISVVILVIVVSFLLPKCGGDDTEYERDAIPSEQIKHEDSAPSPEPVDDGKSQCDSPSKAFVDYQPTPRFAAKTIKAAYDEGYENGYDDGEEDGMNNDEDGSYDESNPYSGRMREAYIQGYQDGYEEGKEDGIDVYNEDRDPGDEEDW